MREILFRGRSENGNGWVEGSLVITNIEPADDTPIKHYHIEDMTIGVFPNEFQSGLSETVDPETVGQYTGLTDKNGKKIFEGDIVRYNTFDDFDCHSVVKFGEYEQDGSAGEYNPRDCIGWYVEVDNFTCPDWAENDPSYFNDYLKQQNLLEVSVECEIIGNIHDNPELLEVAADGAQS